MQGRIYARQKCRICKSTFQWDERRSGLFCPAHPGEQATKGFIVRFSDLSVAASTYRQAETILTGVRWEKTRNTFDRRDYSAANPLGFQNLFNQWLGYKEKECRPGTLRNLRSYGRRFSAAWSNTNIREIKYAQLQDFFHDLKGQVSDKTRWNLVTSLKEFFKWFESRERGSTVEFKIPEFPKISYELEWRTTVDLDTQQAIIDELKVITDQVNPKIWIAVTMLAHYPSIRPAELIALREEDIDLHRGILIVRTSKEKRAKIVPLIDDDLDMLRTITRGMPGLFFFRHDLRTGTQAGEHFGPKLLYVWWKRACRNLNIEGVDLYGGTKHSTVMAMREHFTPEEIRRATMHTTNKAFERYLQIGAQEVKRVYGFRQCTKSVQKKSGDLNG